MALTLLQPFNLDTTANFTFNSITVSTGIDLSGTGNVNLGSVSNIRISGGTNGYVLSTDGTGNLSWVAVTSNPSNIANGNSNVSISTANGNITFSAVGNANVAVITGTGVNVNGTLNTTGNLITLNANLGNLAIANFFSGSGNLLSNIQAGNITGTVANANYSAYAGNLIGSIANANYANYAGNAFSVTGSNVSGEVANANYATYSGTAFSVTGSNVSGTVANANYATYSGTAFGISGSNVSGEVANANYATYSGTAYAVSGSNVSGTVANANYSAYAGNVIGSIANANYANYAGNAFSVTGSNVSGEVANANYATYSGTAFSVTGSNVSGEVANANYATYAGTVITASQPNITSIGTLTDLNVSGNAIIGGNITVSGTTTYINVTNLAVSDPVIQLQSGPNGAAPASNTGKDVGTALNYYDTQARVAFMGWDVSNAEFGFGNTVSISSEVVTFTSYGNVRAGYFIGNGSQLTGLTATANGGNATNLTNGTSNVRVINNGNIAFSVAGNANIEVITGTGVNIAGYMNATGNVTGNYIIGNGAFLTGVDLLTVGNADQANYISNGTSNINTPILNGNITVGINGTANTVIFTQTGVNVAGYMTATGNVTGSYILGNGFFLSGVDASGRVVNGTSNLNIATSGGNITMSVNGTSNVEVVTSTGVNIAGYMTATGNVTGSYILGNGFFLGGIDAAGRVVNGTSNLSIATLGGNITMSVGGNPNIEVVTSTGVNIAGYMTATGNVTGNYILGNGFFLGGIDAAGRVVNGTSNLNIATSGGNITMSVGGTANVVTVSNTTLTVANTANIANLVVTGAANLGNVSNLTITGGINGYVLSTDGAGALSWVAQSGGPGGGSVVLSDVTTNATFYPVFANANTGNMTTAYLNSSLLTFNPSSGTLTAQDLNTLSDITLKDNVEPIEDPFTILNKLDGIGFNWKNSGKRSYGVIAQMFEKVLPELVNETPDGKKTVNYIPIIAFLLEAVKKQQKDIDQLKKRKR